MLEPNELKKFQSQFKELYNKALDHLMYKEWRTKVDRHTRIHIPVINDREIHFELMHTMMGQLLETKSLTWEEINNLEIIDVAKQTNS